ncbi:hypothetical protein RSAG_04733 [Ruminococcus sp. 5_1_39BFAA]|nr:hypothetical protein RSAG_04733 [Ruminococcus sp. 5_1_39BFAA]
MTEYSGGKFRKKKVNFSMISNEIIRDDTVSLKTKGLYALIQSYITMDDFTLYKGFLMSKCPEGRRSFDSAWNQLKQSGYLIQYRMKDEKNHFYYEYELLDVPVHQNVTPEKTGTSVVSVCDSSDCVVHKVDDTQNDAIYKTLQNNTVQNNTVSSHISESAVMDMIGYDASLHDDFIENLVLLIVEVLNMPDQATIRVNQTDQKAELVKERFRKLRYKHIEYVRLVFSEFTGEISSMRNYLITSLYNAVSTCDIYFKQRVQHDMYEKGDKTWQVVK